MSLLLKTPKLENEEDVSKDIAKAIEEAYGFSCYFGKVYYYFFFDFLQVIFWAVAVSMRPHK